MAAGATGERSFQETPTWAVAVVCVVFVIISLLIEHGIHSLGKWFRKRRNKALIEALEKIKAELMLLGFISLLLTVATTYITRICIPSKLGNTMLPCRIDATKKDQGGAGRRKLLSNDENVMWRRVLAGSGGDDFCTKNGKVPLISQIAVHQLHILIFVLAVFHILYSVITMALGQAKFV
uniref:MLO-like protein n=1 Tax=Quercus lobata TaxID=97700 RepID=A0A7N2KTT6_QUELO